MCAMQVLMALLIPALAFSPAFAAGNVIVEIDAGTSGAFLQADECSDPRVPQFDATTSDSCTESDGDRSTTGTYSLTHGPAAVGECRQVDLDAVLTSAGKREFGPFVIITYRIHVADQPAEFTIDFPQPVAVRSSSNADTEVFIHGDAFGTYCEGSCGGIGVTDTLLRSGTLPPGDHTLTVTFEATIDPLTNDQGERIAESVSLAASFRLSFDRRESTTFSWVADMGGDYSDAENWNPPCGAPPRHSEQISDTAIFELSGNSPIPVQASSAAAGKWEIGVMTLDLNGSASVLGNSSGLDDLLINRDGGLILDGVGGASSLHTNTARIDSGSVTVDASAGSAVLTVTDELVITGSPQIELLIAGGGEVSVGTLSAGRTSGTSAGDVTVRGVSPAGVRSTLAVNGSSEPAVFGATAPGRLNVQAGGSAALFGGLTVGLVSDGFVLVSGQDAPDGVVTELRVVGETNVGIGTASSVQIQTRARMKASGNVNVGVEAADSSISVGESSFLDVEGTLTIGLRAAAELNINDAQVSCDSLAVGGGDAGPAEAGGAVTLDGFTGLLEVRGNADVGVGRGSGNIILNLGLSMIVDGTMTIGGGAGGGNVLLLDALIGGAGNVLVGQNGILRGIGTVSVPKTRLAGTNAFISPGLSPGTLTIDGDYEQAEGGTLIIEVAGLEPGQFDVLHVTGNATLSGNVDLRFINGFVPQRGDNVNFVVVDGALTGKLTGSTFIDAPGDPESGQSAVQAEVRWEVTPEGTCRITVADVVPVNEGSVPLPTECGAGLCGAGAVPTAGLTLLALCGRRNVSARRRPRST